MKEINIKPRGRIGNNIFQYFLARKIKEHVNCEISCFDKNCLKSFAIKDLIYKEKFELPEKRIGNIGHRTNVGFVIDKFKKDFDFIEIDSYTFQMNYFQSYLNLFRETFSIKDSSVPSFGEKYLLIHIRLGDTLFSNCHPDMPITPFSWYRHLIKSTGLQPVFIGELSDDVVSKALKLEFKNAIFINSANPIDDFEMIRRSKNKAISVSTFSYLASFLSSDDCNIFMPVYGLFNPRQRGDVNMIIDDNRFKYYEFGNLKWSASKEQITEIISKNDAKYEELNYEKLLDKIKSN